ncbi:dipeptide ABC transporter ATP-binding protein [Ferruginibacter yonginensis]|uniref:Dipeptide ABC transporter ATP-binding protein n=1 Tax=Ferruginibacter yonginensis TaxID=1310416 RepID=A0ABV8QUB5_9BACT
MSVPLVQVNNLHIQFCDNEGLATTVVNNISFNVPRGQITALIGESGSGKSVTALSFLQLLPKQATINGEILLSEDDVTTTNLLTLPAKAMQQLRGNKVAMIFQEPMTALNPVYTCGIQVMEAIIQHKKLSKAAAKKAVIDLFTLVELPEPEQLFKKYPYQISGGQKQRVMIAMAMSCGPALLIADEPTTALDVRVQKNILLLIKKLQHTHQLSVLFITHDLTLVAAIAENVVVLYKGNVVEQGATKNVLQQPQHAYTKALLLCKPSPAQKGFTLPTVAHLMHQTLVPIPIATAPVIESNPILSIKNVTIQYPVKKNIFGKPTQLFTAVNKVSFDVYKNEIIGIVGESGCGKTTLGNAILGLQPLTEGSITLNQQVISNATAAQMKQVRSQMQMVFQDPYGSLNPRISIGDAIMEPMVVHQKFGSKKQQQQATLQLLAQVNMPASTIHKFPHQLSGGQRQRICIARALAVEPSFLVFDESVAALDVSVQAQVLNLINELKASHSFTAIFISHDLAVVQYLCNRVMVMQQGVIVETGKVNDVFFNPQHAYTKELLAALPNHEKW